LKHIWEVCVKILAQIARHLHKEIEDGVQGEGILRPKVPDKYGQHVALVVYEKGQCADLVVDLVEEPDCGRCTGRIW